jgi:hypothetical protein
MKSPTEQQQESLKVKRGPLVEAHKNLLEQRACKIDRQAQRKSCSLLFDLLLFLYPRKVHRAFSLLPTE